jgi:hypothetical protein
MQFWLWSVLALFAVLVALYLGHRAGRLRLVAVLLQFMTGASFVLAYGALSTDYRDADGAFDCWPSCDLIQELTVLGLLVAPILFLVASIAALFGREPRPPSGSRQRY